jgi:hypothetical protein
MAANISFDAGSGSRLQPTSRRTPCPICTRQKDGDCRIGDDLVFCHYGSSHHPPKHLKPGDVHPGFDGQQWAFTGDTSDGRAAIFTIHRPRQSPRPAPATAAVGIQIAALPKPAGEPPEHWPHGTQLPYSDQQTVVVLNDEKGKRHIPHNRNANGREIPKAGPQPWPLWHEAEVIEHGPGRWIIEAEGEKCTEWIRAGGRVGTTQPGHDHKIENIEARYRRLHLAGVVGIVYLADNDKTGREKAEKCQRAAAAAGLHFRPLHAAEVWPGICGGGSIDDAPGSAADRVAAVVSAAQQWKPAGSSKRPSTAERLAQLDAFADQLLNESSTIPVGDRLIHLRHQADELNLNLRDGDLQRRMWSARRRKAGAVEMFAPGMVGAAEAEAWAWEGIVMAGDTNLIAALPKVGKTSLVLDAIARWHRGDGEHLGRRFHGPCLPVIIAGTDMPRRRWFALMERFGLAEQVAPGRWQLPIDGPIRGLYSQESPVHLDSDGINRLAEDAAKHPGALIIVDSYAKCCQSLGLKEASSDYAGPLGDLQEAVSPHGATLVVIHHSGHGRTGEGAVAACRGTSALPAAVSQVVALSWLNKGRGSADRRVVLQTEGRGGEPLQLLIEQEDNGWSSHGEATEIFEEQRRAEAEDELHDRQAAACDLVRERWENGRHRTTSNDLIEALELRGSSAAPIARRTLKQLERRGLVESIKESTGSGQVVWFWPAGQVRANTFADPSVPPVRSVPSSPHEQAPPKHEIPGAGREGTLQTEGTHRKVRTERTAGVFPPPSAVTPLAWHPVALRLRSEKPELMPFTVALELEQQGFPGVSGREVAELFHRNPPIAPEAA